MTQKSGLEARGPKGRVRGWAAPRRNPPLPKARRVFVGGKRRPQRCYETESCSGVNVRLNGSALSISWGIVARTPLPNC